MRRRTSVVIHGHFYQPPRENPWLEMVELQDSAFPYHDWNERITAECYRPNASARIVDGQGRIVDIIDNYERISFNVGPTLLAWMEREAPDVHRAPAHLRSRRRLGARSVGRRRELGLVDVAQPELGAGARERERRLASDPVRRTGDQRQLAVQLPGHRFLRPARAARSLRSFASLGNSLPS